MGADHWGGERLTCEEGVEADPSESLQRSDVLLVVGSPLPAGVGEGEGLSNRAIPQGTPGTTRCLTQFLYHESSAGSGRVACGEVAHVPAGLEGQQQLEEHAKERRAAGPAW